MNPLVESEPSVQCGPSRLYLAVVALFLLAANTLTILFVRHRIPLDLPFASAALCLNVYLALFFLLGNRDIQPFLQERIAQNRGFTWLFIALLLGSYLTYALGTQSLQAVPFLKLLTYILLPTTLLAGLRNPSDRLRWQELLAILVLWLPLDFRWTRDAWAWPRHSLAYSMNSLLATCLAVFLFVLVRRLQGVGYHYHFNRSDWWLGIRNFACFAPIAILIGLATGFISVSSRFAPWWEFLLSAIGIFIFVAIPEELLFRGIIQNFLQRSFLRPVWALVVTSIIFGAAHLNNGPHQPDWRYFLLATIAGLFYGNAYNRAGSLLAPALVHTLVDAVWRGFFR